MNWIDRETGLLHETPIFSINRVVRENREGTRGSFIRLDAPDWVTVIPVLSESLRGARFCMVRQFRHGSGKISLEFPAGMVDPGETPEAAAARELKEETGLVAGKLILLGAVNPNPAFMNNLTHTFLALDLSGDGRQELDHHEDIQIEEHDEGEIERMMGKNPLDSAIMVQAYYWYTIFKKGK